MDCFRNYIGLRGCGSAVPPSAFYINSLAGISLPAMEGISDSEQRNYKGVWNDVQDRALMRLEADILNALQPTIRIPRIHSLEIIGQFIDPIQLSSNPGQLTGIYFELLYSEYMGILIEDITVYSAIVQTINLKLFDVSTGTLITTFTANLQTGYNVIPINREYFNTPGNNRYFLAYDSTVTQLGATNGNRSYPIWDTECSTHCPWDIGAGYPNIYGGSCLASGPINRHTIRTSGPTYGLCMRYQLRCSLSAYVCRIRDRFRQALAFLLGTELVLERIMSTRLNQWTILNRDDLYKLRDEYEAQYDRALKTAIDSVDLPNDFCFQCEPMVSTQFIGF